LTKLSGGCGRATNDQTDRFLPAAQSNKQAIFCTICRAGAEKRAMIRSKGLGKTGQTD
jgi:hypothetical protein